MPNSKVMLSGSKFVVRQEYTFMNGDTAIPSAPQIGVDGTLVRASSLLSKQYPLTLLSNKAHHAVSFVVGDINRSVVGDIITTTPAGKDACTRQNILDCYWAS